MTEKFNEAEYSDCFIVDVKVSPANKIEVYIDSDSSLTLKRCQQISRYLEQTFDSENWFGEKYTLEVSSPGVGTPLKFKRQYVKNVGRGLVVKLADGGTVKGKLEEVGDEGILLVVQHKEKGKKAKAEHREIAFDDIDNTKVTISFK